MHLGGVKVGLLRLAKPEVMSSPSFGKKNSTIIFRQTLTTPNIEKKAEFDVLYSKTLWLTFQMRIDVNPGLEDSSLCLQHSSKEHEGL